MQSSHSKISGGKKRATGLAVAVLAAVYSLVTPILNERMGWDLPALGAADKPAVDQQAANKSAADKPAADRQAADQRAVDKQAVDKRAADKRAADKQAADKQAVDKGPGQPVTAEASRRPPAVVRETVTRTSDAREPSVGKKDTTETDVRKPEADLKYGLLRDVGGDRYVSPAGLMYTRGSAEGHRLNHIQRHTVDDPGRPGKHGVFDGGMEDALATIDRAYTQAQAKQRTSKQVDGDRTIYTVDLGGRIGFVGGRDGNRNRKPMARRVRLVLEGNRVITAYPM